LRWRAAPAGRARLGSPCGFSRVRAGREAEREAWRSSETGGRRRGACAEAGQPLGGPRTVAQVLSQKGPAMKRLLLAALGGTLLLGSWAGRARTADEKSVSKLMRRKLEQSQKVLEGVALQDYKMIARHAEELIEVSKQAEWRALRTAQYEVYSNDFRRIA